MVRANSDVARACGTAPERRPSSLIAPPSQTTKKTRYAWGVTTPRELVFPFANVASPVARVFCFPFVGGGAVAFRSWRALLPAGVELCAFEPPARGGRLQEPP